jgi:hypothetical protein
MTANAAAIQITHTHTTKRPGDSEPKNHTYKSASRQQPQSVKEKTTTNKNTHHPHGKT